MYLLLIEFDADFAANSFELPPIMFVELLDDVHVIGKLFELWVWTTGVKDAYDDVDPAFKLSWLDEHGKNLHTIAHIEDLANNDHELKLIL